MEKVKRAWDRRLIRNLLLVLPFVYAVALGLHAASVSSVSAKTKKKETVALEKCNITWDLEKGKTLNSKIVYIDGSTKKIKRQPVLSRITCRIKK